MRYMLFIVLSVIVFGSCGSESNIVSTGKEKKSEYLEIGEKIAGDFKTVPVSDGLIIETVTIQGSIKPNENKISNIVPLVSGIVTEVYKQMGDKVKKGDVLLSLSSKEMGQARLNYIDVFHKKNLAWKRYKIERDIYKKQIGSKLSYLVSKEGFHNADVARKLVWQRLKMLGLSDKEIRKIPRLSKSEFTLYDLKAPVDGIIIKKHASLGEYIGNSDIAYTVARLDDVWVDFKVSEKYIPHIKVNGKVEVTSCILNQKSTGKIIYVSPTVDEKTRNVPVRVLLKNISGMWRPGSCVTGKFVLDSKHSKLVVPRTAVISIEGKSSVFVELKPGKYSLVQVLTGKYDDKHIEIKGNLKKGDKVVFSNVILLKGQWLINMGDE